MILFWIGSSRVMKSGSPMSTGDFQDSGWTPMSHPDTSQRRKLTKKDHGYCMVNLQQSEPGKTAFVDFIESQACNFYANGINRLVFLWQKCTDSNGVYFD
ncbi:unnamed protein product [Euphydryas editha]|uniref:Uncharacterized protein n=1 Tax=Euphydryas editha TaxID=104508 RepID=A0AAU9USU5_EUPED|nr:unnamed protein product [Euphydryas editha]